MNRRNQSMITKSSDSAIMAAKDILSTVGYPAHYPVDLVQEKIAEIIDRETSLPALQSALSAQADLIAELTKERDDAIAYAETLERRMSGKEKP